MFFVRNLVTNEVIRAFVRDESGRVVRDSMGRLKRGAPFVWHNKSVATQIADYLTQADHCEHLVEEAS